MALDLREREGAGGAVARVVIFDVVFLEGVDPVFDDDGGVRVKSGSYKKPMVFHLTCIKMSSLFFLGV